MATTQTLSPPINRLPSEILTRIFLYAAESQYCTLRKNTHRFTPIIPDYPDSLLLVSSRWHDIAISLHSLWSHIDIVLSCPQSAGFLARAKVYASRAGQIPLDIHIIDPGTHLRYQLARPPRFFVGDFNSSEDENENNNNMEHDDNEEDSDEDGSDDDLAFTVSSENEMETDSFPETHQFSCLDPTLASVPICSIDLVAHCKYHMSQPAALQYYLSRCAPGTLRQLLVHTHLPDDKPLGHFIEHGYVGRSLNIKREGLERPMGTLSTLHLKGLYLYWTSQAYRELTDLYLGGMVRIPEHQLIEILKSNPRLQALRLSCWITDPTARRYETGLFQDEPPFDVYLESLKILDIHALDCENATLLLRRLSYSSNPLCLCLPRVDRDDDVSRVLFRSKNLNVTELRITSCNLDGLYEYLEKYSKLRVLVIGRWRESKNTINLLVPPKCGCDLWWYYPGKKSELCLDTLYMTRLRIPENELQIMVDYYSVRRVVLWGCVVIRSGGKTRYEESNITALCPIVDILDGSKPSPVRE
ncbi:hypothetical protein RHS04_06966 [Rhizoctonia solani]|uniref:F-box domain-containing protein n=1 Tax=Rhizoctonia solani TaxID=456999 RepID=A0A8H7LI72_9AGAM|nr:hypothetical protein RHS04_06966 [Rhizoctonia solani]